MPWMSRGALEYIGQAALGHSFNALDTTRHDEYTEAVRNLGYVPSITVMYPQLHLCLSCLLLLQSNGAPPDSLPSFYPRGRAKFFTVLEK